MPVCQAIQHAHQKGIIHRDIKPSNVLVAEYDDRPVPKVIDFGVAKATEKRLTEKTMFTLDGQIVGTIGYMSPEQANLNQQDVDTRSDVYSLGVLLYELLTGETPFDRVRLRSAAFDELLRIIREEDPPKPSLRLSSSDSLPSIAANRRVEPKKLGTLVSGELDWIVMKALEKDRTRRYETANGFAIDIQRYLSDEPVEASPPSRGYRLRKFVRRNKTALAMVSVVALALVVGLAGTTWQAFRATIAEGKATRQQQIAEQRLTEADEQRKLAKTNEARATDEAAKAKAVVDLLQEMLGSANPSQVKGADYTVRELLDHFSANLGDQLKNQPEVEADLRSIIGLAYWRLTMFDKAAPHLGRALELRREIFGNEHEKVAESLVDYAMNEGQRGGGGGAYGPQGAKGLALAREAVAIYRKTGGQPEGMIHALRWVQFFLDSQGNYAEADAIAREALAIAQEANRMETQDVADILHVLAGSKLHQGDHSEAVRLAREAVALHRRVHGNEHPETGHGLGILAGALEAQGDLTTAEAHYRETLAIFRKQYGEYNWTVSWFMRKLAAVLRAQGKPEEAEGIYRAFFSQTPHIWQDFMERASVYAERGEHELALEDREKGVALLERLVAKFPDQPDRVEQLHSEYSRLGNLLRDIGRLDDAEKVYCKAMAISEKLTTDFPDVLEYQQELAKVHCHRARARRAIPNTSPEVLDYFDSGAIANTTAWEHVTDTRTAPVGTRLVRVRLWSVRNGGTNNDGYFDDLSFRDPTGGNLLANPGNEKGLADGKIPGWTTDGTWQRRARDPMPHGGMAYFFPGARALAELRQDVDVSAHAAVVDAGKLQFTFEGYVRSFKQTPADTSRIILEYRSTGSSLKADTISEDYLKAIELGADDTVCAEYIGWMRLNGDADKAYRNVISRLQKVIDEFPEEPESRQERAKIYRRLGKAHREKGDSDQSIAAYTEAIRLDPELTVAREGRGNTYREKGEFAKAVTDYGEAIRRDPKRVQAHMFRAECYCKIGEYDKANADLDAASQLDPRSSPVLYNITAWSLVTSQDLQPRDAVWAVQLANKAVKLSPGEESYWNTLGVAQYRAGEWKAVIATLEKAIGLRSGVDSSDWFFLAMAHCQLGEKDKARQWYNKAVEWMDEHKPEDEELRRFRAEAAELLGVDEKPKAESGERETAPPQSPTLPGGSDAETPTKEEGTENDR